MIKKIFNILFDIIFIAGVLGIIYFFYYSNHNESLLEDGALPYIAEVSTSESAPKTINTITYNESDSSNSYVTNSNVATRYYYNQLDNYGKAIYATLQNNINNLKNDNYTLDFSTKFNSLLNQSNGMDTLNNSFQSALDAFFYDHPELFYLDLSKFSLITKYKSFAGITTYTVTITPNNSKNYLASGFTSKEQVDNAIGQVETLKNRIVTNVKGDNYQKALAVHDTLVDFLEYDTSVSKPNIYNIYGAFTQKQVVCEGYSKAFKYIMDCLNIPCILVAGTGTNSSGKTEAHMWNYIQLNGSWYAVDVTWDDPIIIGGISTKQIRHDHFCKGSYSFNSSHKSSGKISESGMNFTYPTLSTNNYKNK